MDPKLLQKIRDKLLGVTESAVGGLNTSIYLQQIRDAVLGVTREAHGNLNEVVYLQQIRNAIKGVPDGQFGSLAAHVYLQEIRDAFNDVTSNPVGSMDEDLYLEEIYDVAVLDEPTYSTLLRSLSVVNEWTLADASGVTAVDVVGGNNGTYRNTAGVLNGITLNQAGISGNSALFNGTSGFVTVSNNITKAVIETQEFSIAAICKVVNSGIWAESAYRMVFTVAAGANNYVRIGRFALPNYWQFDYKSGGTQKIATKTPVSDTDFFHICFTVSRSDDKAMSYINGVPLAVGGLSGLGVWAPGATSIFIGSVDVSANWPWSGWIQHVSVANRAWTPTEVATLSGKFF